LLANYPIWESDDYIERAAVDGPRVYLGNMTSEQIEMQAIRGRFNTIVHASYTWSIVSCGRYFLHNIKVLRQDMLKGTARLKPIARDVLSALILKYEHTGASEMALDEEDQFSIVDMVILLDDVELLEMSRQLGHSYNHCMLDDARSCNVMEKLHEFGCMGSSELVLHCIKKMRHLDTETHNEYIKMMKFAISNGYKIRNEDVEYALEWGVDDAIAIIHDAGFKITDEMLEKTSRYTEDFVEGLVYGYDEFTYDDY